MKKPEMNFEEEEAKAKAVAAEAFQEFLKRTEGMDDATVSCASACLAALLRWAVKDVHGTWAADRWDAVVKDSSNEMKPLSKLLEEEGS